GPDRLRRAPRRARRAAARAGTRAAGSGPSPPRLACFDAGPFTPSRKAKGPYVTIVKCVSSRNPGGRAPPLQGVAAPAQLPSAARSVGYVIPSCARYVRYLLGS